MLMLGAVRKLCPGQAAWLLGLAVMAASAAVAAAEAQVAGRTSVEAAKSLPEDDYYSKRAKSLLVEDAADTAKLVSLQAAYPGHNVVMCEAGCYGGSKRLVQFAPIVVTNAQPSRTLVPTSDKMSPDKGGDNIAHNTVKIPEAVTAEPAAAAPAAAEEITCVAGCYGASRSYRAASRSSVLAATRAEVEQRIQSRAAVGPGAHPSTSAQASRGATGPAASRWMTTSAKADGDDRSVTRATASPATAKKRTAFAKSTNLKARRRAATPSGEWFQQINSDRSSSPN